MNCDTEIFVIINNKALASEIFQLVSMNCDTEIFDIINNKAIASEIFKWYQ